MAATSCVLGTFPSKALETRPLVEGPSTASGWSVSVKGVKMAERNRIACCALLTVLATNAEARDGDRRAVVAASSFATHVAVYDPAASGGCVPTNPNFTDPNAAVGAPDYSGGASGTGAVSLGSGGRLELFFATSCIINSGDTRVDLRIHEVGGFGEDFFVAVRPVLPTTPAMLLAAGMVDANGDGYFELGRIGAGASSNIDIDARMTTRLPEGSVCFDAVQIIDDLADTPACTSTVGADIDAVEAALAYLAVEGGTWSTVKKLYR
jgi:hypothetical protein